MTGDQDEQEERQRPTQAVILAGGRGTRLRPLTDTRPKPMVEFHGKPFLEYLVCMLRDQGFDRILLLLGYLPHIIRDHFGDGSRWGVRIEYQVSDAEDETGRRLWLARDRLDPLFLLLYCDNYWPLRFDAMWRQFCSNGASGLVTVYRNSEGYSRNNLRVDDAGYVTCYDRSRTQPHLQGVDIGFLILQRDVIHRLPDENVSFEGTVYRQLVAERRLQGFVTDHRYYSVGSHERLPLTDRFLARQPAVFLDRDGTLNRRMPRAEYVRSWEDWEWLPGVKEGLRRFTEAGYRIVIISNQAGIARGAMTEPDLAKIHERMIAEAREAGGEITAVYYCPHGWDDGCECRKPKPGMLHQAQRDLDLDLSLTPVIGDDVRDLQAAEAAGSPGWLVTENVTLLDVTRELLEHTHRQGRILAR
jgi:histidinol-phosphate phosphatase family protein